MIVRGMRHTGVSVVLLLAGMGLWGPSAAAGQAASLQGGRPRTVEAEPSLDRRILYGVYHVDAPVFRGYMYGIDATAYPVFFGSVPVLWGGAVLFGDGRAREAAYRATLAEFVATGGVIALKKLFRRPRPYVVLYDIESRSRTERPGMKRGDSYAFPSGHATIAFALAVSWSLSQPAWHVTAASLVWASSVALSRIWLGVHYPSDVLAGIVFGAAVAAVVHLLGPVITPAFLRADEAQIVAPALRIRLLRL